MHSVVPAITGIRLAALHLSSALNAKTSISARRAFHCRRQFNVLGFDNGKNAGRYSQGSLQWPCPGHAVKLPIRVLYTAFSSPLSKSGG